MKTRTWPYGTRKEIKVIYRETIQWHGRTVPIIAAKEPASGEGFVLLDGGGEDAKPGDVGTIIFTQGGPAGGHWKFESNQTEKDRS